MAKYRERFNDKARAGNVQKRNALKAKRQKQYARNQDDQDAQAVTNAQPQESQDTNNDVLIPITAAEKAQRKRELSENLGSQDKTSSVKRKRLDKYIDRQVRREEKDEIFAKLAQSRVDTASYQSLKQLGTKSVLQKTFQSEDSGESDEDSEGTSDSEAGLPAITSEMTSSTFIDNRPKSGGFGFQNLPVAKKTPVTKRKTTWRERLGIVNESPDEKNEESDDFDDSSDVGDDSGDSDDGGDGQSENEDEDESELSETSSDSEAGDANGHISDQHDTTEEEVWNGFSDGATQEQAEVVAEHDTDDEVPEKIQESRSSAGREFLEWIKSTAEQRVSLKTPAAPKNYKHTPRIEEHEPLPNDTSQGPVTRQGTYSVTVKRDPEVEASRMELPATASEQQIMEAVHNFDYLVITGETGSGKTTQIPQFLYESGYGSPDSVTPGMIGVTQPRRVAAVSMAQRVGNELGDHGKSVGYQIRFDAKTDANTRIKFMTDGVLLKEMSTDLMLSKYSAIVIDEAHERSVNTDILIGILSRVVKLRRESGTPLKLIIMSATLRVSDFTMNKTLFDVAPPVVSVEARQYPVSIHFSRKTLPDYVDEAVSKTLKIHERLPKGGILIFLTGQNEITRAIRDLRQYEQNKSRSTHRDTREEDQVRVRMTPGEATIEEENVELDFDDNVEAPVDVEEDDEDEAGERTVEEGFEEQYDGEETKLHILPLYSLLPTKEQLKVFEKPPPGSRLCVVATNVAETSLTIPGIRYVVDCGRSKQRVYDYNTGVQRFRVGWISKASAGQRAGRAGRTGPGHCYRLYSSAVYERDFAQFSQPEILRMPVEGLVLQMKSMGIHHIINFPFPTPPGRENLSHALKQLTWLGALEGEEAQVTALGKQMSFFPLNPRHAKMLLIGNQLDCLPYVIAIVSALSVGDPFVQPWEIGLGAKQTPEEEEKAPVSVEERERLRLLHQEYAQAQARFSALDKRSDALRLLSAVAAYSYAKDLDTFCRKNFLRAKTMLEISKLRKQISYLVASATRPDAIESVTNALSRTLGVPSAQQIAALKQIIAAGYIDQVAIRASIINDIPLIKKTPIVQTPYQTLLPTSSQYVYIHPDSILASLGSQPPDFLVYSALTLGDAENAKVRMRTLVDISATALANIAASSTLITYSKPLGGAYAPIHITPVKREAWVVPRMGAAVGSGGVGWDLPPRKVMQIKVKGDWKVQ